MFNPSAQENTRPDGVSVLEIVPDPDLPPGSPRCFVPLKRTELTGEVAGPLGALRLTQVFGYSRAQCDRVLEALYRFPLPGDAAVVGVQVRFGDVEIRATLRERGRAEAEYDEARRVGRPAALLTRESPDVFTLKVAGIAPDQDVTVATDYVQLARTEGAGWSLRVPLTTSPRYVRSDELSARHAQGQPLALLRDPGHRFALDVFFADVGAVASPTHRLALAAEEDGVRVRLEGGDVVPDRDAVLTWGPKRASDRPSLDVTVHEDAASGLVYFLARVGPPQAAPAGATLPRETVVLVDHSGSMQGPKWEAADWAVKKFLTELTERDSFALGVFHNTTTWLGKGVRPATAAAVQEAVAFLESRRDSGGTELGVALEQALDRPRLVRDAARHVLLITDAEVTDAGRILRLAEQESRRPDRRRIDVLCIDAAPNAFLASALAERGGGVSRFLTSDPQEEDITTALDEVLADWAAPVSTGLRLEVNRPQVEAAGRPVLSGDGGPAIDLGDLPAGRGVWVAGRVPRAGAGELTFRLTAAVRELASRRVAAGGPARPALKALFGARRVLGLEFLVHAGYAGSELADQLRHLGYEPDDVLGPVPSKAKVYAENVLADAEAALKRLLVREALDYGLASSETAFVAVRSEPGKPVDETVVVANALPAGWSGAFLGAPAAGSMLLCKMAAPAPATPNSFADADASVGYASAAFAFAPPPAPARTQRLARGRKGSPASPAPATASPGTGGQEVFAGIPTFAGGEAVLFDSARAEDTPRLPEAVTLVRLRVEFPGGVPDAAAVDPGLTLLLFVDDLAAPRARVRLADLVRHGGERPLNLRRESGQRVRLVLEDRAGAWAASAPALKVTLDGTS
jgi:Ca-activated chloride channel homolog